MRRRRRSLRRAWAWGGILISPTAARVSRMCSGSGRSTKIRRDRSAVSLKIDELKDMSHHRRYRADLPLATTPPCKEGNQRSHDFWLRYGKNEWRILRSGPQASPS